jgi:hypothetical protein
MPALERPLVTVDPAAPPADLEPLLHLLAKLVCDQPPADRQPRPEPDTEDCRKGVGRE